MKFGYARTSTVEQIAGLEAQERELRSAGAEKVFSERVSSVARREQLEAALDYCREGDVLVVTKLDRLARSMADLVAITSKLRAKGVALNILAMQLDTITPTGKLAKGALEVEQGGCQGQGTPHPRDEDQDCERGSESL